MASKKNSRKKVSKKVAKTTSNVGHITYKLGDLFYVGKDFQTMEVAFINAGKAFMKPIGGFIVEAVIDEWGLDRNGIPAVSVKMVDRITEKVAKAIQDPYSVSQHTPSGAV
jgi:hypothetical protein